MALLMVACTIGFLSCDPQNEPTNGHDQSQTEQNEDVDDGGIPGSLEKNISTGIVIETKETEAILSGKILVDITDYQSVKFGVMYSEDKTELELYKGTKLEGKELNGMDFNVTINELWHSTTYYYRAYILLNDMQYFYGNIKSFTTLTLTHPGYSVAEGKYVSFYRGNVRCQPSSLSCRLTSEQYVYDVSSGYYYTYDEDDDKWYELFNVDAILKINFSCGRLLTNEELYYLLVDRPHARDLSGYVALSFVNSTSKSPYLEKYPSLKYRTGFVIFPDRYKPTQILSRESYEATIVSQTEWEQMEQNGAVMFVLEDLEDSGGTNVLSGTYCTNNVWGGYWSFGEFYFVKLSSGFVKLVEDLE